MQDLTRLNRQALQAYAHEMQEAYQAFLDKHLSINMARGKPAPEQLDLSDALFNLGRDQVGVRAADGTDCRNYGDLCGIPECRALFGEVFGVPAANVIACGSSSLNLMYDYISQCYALGVAGHEPWVRQGPCKYIAIVPGYDRHFAIAAHFGLELVNVPMTPTGPDMDRIRELVKDPSVKGMFCVPKYSNPDGITYSDDTVEAIAALKPAAPDFRVIWDEAYLIHDLYGEKDELKNIFDAAKKYGSEDLFVAFASTSKITFAGAGVAAIAASDANIKEICGRLTIQIISYDKINQLKHSYFYKTKADLEAQMARHAEILRPKFDAVLNGLREGLEGAGVASYNAPKGGYFISLDVNVGSARRVGELCKAAGLTLTPVGATYPYGKDPNDANIRIAPSCPSVEELEVATALLTTAVKLAACEALLREKSEAQA